MIDGSAVRHLPLETLRTFVAASELGSFTRAGAEVHRSQSAVSMQMKRLEAELGCRLFERNSRNVCLTPEGVTLMGYARRLLRLHDEALVTLSRHQVAGEVRLGVPDDYATRQLPAVLARFARTHPMVKVEVCCDTTAALRQLLTARKLDVCVFTSDGSPDGGEVLLHNPLVWAASRFLECDLSQRGGLPLAVFHEGCLIRRWALQALQRAGIPHRIAYSSPSLAGILAAVRSGFAVAPLALGSVSRQDRELVPLGQDSGLPVLPAVTVTLNTAASPLSEAANQLARQVREGFGVSGSATRHA